VDPAIVHYQKAVAIEPNNALFHRNLGRVLIQRGRAQEAVEHYQAALAIQPADVATLNNLAWVLATWPEASVRNGPKAVELAQRACRLSGGDNSSILATLAAAYAEAGQFAEAVATATKALALASAQTNTAPANLFRARIELYRSGLPYREARAQVGAGPAAPPTP
jgi:Flp pilus assembly protein TadD